MLAKFAHWDVVVGCVLMGALAAWEMAGVFDARLMTITQWIKSWMPMALRVMIWAWLGWHFIGSDLWAAK